MTTFAFHCGPCEQTFEFEAKSAPKAAPCPSCGSSKTKKTTVSSGTTGTYRYSAALGTTVRVSAHVPGLSRAKAAPRMPAGPACPPQGCGRCH